MKSPKSLYSRLALITSVTLVVGYFVVYAVYENINSEEVASNAIITSTLMGKIKNNLDTLNTQVTDLTATVVASSIWSKVGSDINYTAGKVGVGATTGNAELDIQSGIKPHWGIYHDSTTEELRFWNGDNRVVIGSTGNVGIGTVSPFSKLFVASGEVFVDYANGGATKGGALRLATNANTAFIGSNHYYDAQSAQGKYARSGGGGIINFDITNTSSAGDISFQTFPSGIADAVLPTANNVMTIKQNGNVGIGTPSPTQKLDVNGAVAIHSVGTTTLIGKIQMENNLFHVITPAGKQWEFRDDGTIWFYDGTSWTKKSL